MNYVDNPFESPAVISFCPGILGIERGLSRVGIECRVAAYVEIESFIIANLVAAMEQGVLAPAPIWSDAKTFDGFPFRGKVHGIIGGYPCPGESVAGLREGHLYKGFIWPSIRRTIAAAKPLWCFFENVDDHLTGTYPIVQRSLRNMGYSVEAGVYSAQEAGAPHERQRLFILGIMVNSNCNGNKEKHGYTGGAQNTEGIESQEKKWKRVWSKSFPTSKNVAERSSMWPMPQGFQQFDWEAARVTQPGMGCAINGYDFTEDFFRAYGNSVVEQTAEVAFRDLIRKHLSNLSSHDHPTL